VTRLEPEPSRRSDVPADEGDPTGLPDHSAVGDEADAAAGEADREHLLGMRADDCELQDAEVQVDRQREEPLPASMPTMTAPTVAAG